MFLLLLLAVSLAHATFLLSDHNHTMAHPPNSRDSVWAPASPILAAVQAAQLYPDSKDFVDCPLLVDPVDAWSRWHQLTPHPDMAALENFVKSTFGPPGTELEHWAPPDFSESPPLLARLRAADAPAAAHWAAELNRLWQILGRKFPQNLNPARTTLLPCATHGFVVPGGRFREAYYWDSYWVVLGLLAVDMRTTAGSVTANLLSAVRAYGFVPNGLRTYYLNRSQPPLLTQMVAALVDYDSTTSALGMPAPGMAESQPEIKAETEVEAGTLSARGLQLLREALPLLDREYEWWMRVGPNTSTLALPGMQGAHLNRYIVAADYPRPESWREDFATASSVAEAERPRVYSELAAGAETGWDYSTRWLATHWRSAEPAGSEVPQDTPLAANATESLASIRTSAVVPVDLNSILYRNERTLERLHTLLANPEDDMHDERDDENTNEAPSTKQRSTTSSSAGHGSNCAHVSCEDGSKAVGPSNDAPSCAYHALAARRYGAAADARRRAMDDLMWDGTTGRWHDLEWPSGRKLMQESAASYMPLWAQAHTVSQAARATVGLRESGLLQPGGVATTTVASGQQWDAPNAWPPLQQMLIEGLRTCGAPDGEAVAASLAKRWLRSNYLGWKATGHMHEKYDAGVPGKGGGGGEYTPQVGFGWTNGVVLWLLAKYTELSDVLRVDL